jgi:hypothetical protein
MQVVLRGLVIILSFIFLAGCQSEGKNNTNKTVGGSGYNPTALYLPDTFEKDAIKCSRNN